MNKFLKRNVKNVIDADTIEISEPIEGIKIIRLAHMPKMSLKERANCAIRLKELIGEKSIMIRPLKKIFDRI
ncbi:MAG TPA: hypothetical protein VJH88_01590 [Candidatus Nanoarchaeia archaeon]|nr:hypothetical protein [Candidatus Nanoarchaeia archaeon]